MGLHNPRQTPIGVDAVYWKIVQTDVNWVRKSCVVTLAGWVNKDARDNGKDPFSYEAFTWGGEQFPFVGPDDRRPFGDIVAGVYFIIKLYPGWENSTDVLEENQNPIPPQDPPQDPPVDPADNGRPRDPVTSMVQSLKTIQPERETKQTKTRGKNVTRAKTTKEGSRSTKE